MCGGTVRLLTALLVTAAMGYPSRRSATDLDATPRMTVTFDGKRARGGIRKEAHPAWEHFTGKTISPHRAVGCAEVQRAQPELHHAAAGGRAGCAVRGGQGGRLCPQCQQRGRWLAPHGELVPPIPKQPPNFWSGVSCCDGTSPCTDPLGSISREAAGLPAEGQEQQGTAITGQ